MRKPNGYDYIYQYQDAYYLVFEGCDPEGPYETLQEASQFAELFSVNEATREIETILAAEELVKRLEYSGDQDHTILINDSKWRVSAEGVFSPP